MVLTIQDVNYILADLPNTIKALVRENSDGSYTVILNQNLTREMNIESAEHELRHLKNMDLQTDGPVDRMERIAHR